MKTKELLFDLEFPVGNDAKTAQEEASACIKRLQNSGFYVTYYPTGLRIVIHVWSCDP